MVYRARIGTPTVAIVRYNAGNIRSVVNALRRVSVEPVVTDNAEELRENGLFLDVVRLANDCDNESFTGRIEGPNDREQMTH